MRRQRNPHYSERAFARDLGISQTHLHLILNDKLRKAHRRLQIANREAADAIRLHQQEMLERAQAALRDGSAEAFRRRDMNAVTVAVDSRRLAEAKRRIDAFLDSLTAYLSEG